MRLPENPLVHEIFAWVWLTELERRLGRPVTLADVPEEVWDEVARPGVDAVWLMGVWRRSPRGAEIARRNEAMAAAHASALPDLSDGDVVGSAYCVREYVVDDRLGGDGALASARESLASRGVGLVLDFVPNHVAPDHPWAGAHPEYFVHGDPDELVADPASFIGVGAHVFACGRDPYFPAWPEVIQLDTARPDVRAAAAATVGSIAARCDAIRCDMAMLVLDDVQRATWGARTAPPVDGRGYWPTVFDAVRTDHPDVRFWAEAYWGREPDLLAQGFDACYDKHLYDLLVGGAGAAPVRAHLGGDPDWSRSTVRFTENHDEPRLAATLPGERGRTGTVVAMTVPGVALLHEGQESARRVRVPVTLGRRPDEPPDAATIEWYSALLDAIATGMRRGTWRPLAVDGWPDNPSADRLAAWAWIGPADFVIVANLTGDPADGMLRCDLFGDDEVVLHDRLSGTSYERAAIASDGVYVALGAWRSHLFHVVGSHAG